MPTDGRVLDLEAAIGEVFAVDGVSLRGRGKVVVFSGQYLLEPEQVYEAIVDDFRALGFVPLLRNEDGRDVLVAYPAPDDARSGRRWVNLALFVGRHVSEVGQKEVVDSLIEHVLDGAVRDLGREAVVALLSGNPGR